MGLTIAYQMKVRTDAAGARRLVAAMHAAASKLAFDKVSEVCEYDPPDGCYAFTKGDEDDRWRKPGWVYRTRKREDGLEEHVSVPSLHAMSFVGLTEGAESAEFGLASHPAVVVHHEDIVTYPSDCSESREIGAGDAIEFPTRLRGWYSWSNFCKTQYAAKPDRGGAQNFLRAHFAVTGMIDECRRLGLAVKVVDDGGYWKHRNAQKLLDELSKWDELIAGFVGRLSDSMGNRDGSIVAPIKERPDFEHLEAKGVERLDEIGRNGTKKRRRGRRK